MKILIKMLSVMILKKNTVKRMLYALFFLEEKQFLIAETSNKPSYF